MKPLNPLVKPPITREQLKAYAEASGDSNEIHLKDEVAQAHGLSGVIAHGMLSMAFMGEYVASWLEGQGRLVSFSCRFKAMTYPGDTITTQGKLRGQEGTLAQLTLETVNQKGEITATGAAEVELTASPRTSN